MGDLKRLLPAAFRRECEEQRRIYSIVRDNVGDESVIFSAYRLARARLRPTMKILFYPQVPRGSQVIFKLCLINGYQIVGDPSAKFDAVHKHIDQTVHEDYAFMRSHPEAINSGCRDISKARVQRVFSEVFGYDLAIDPAIHQGPAVRKSDANYRHDGTIIECPVQNTNGDGVVYQRLVETVDSDGFCLDHRVPVVGGQIPLVYLKYRPHDDRFATVSHARVVTTESVFSSSEITLIRQFAVAMHLDFGELDVLRDNSDGRLYIVDVNNTPAGPYKSLSPSDKAVAVRLLADAYRDLIRSRGVAELN
jgi:hypothetical protein